MAAKKTAKKVAKKTTTVQVGRKRSTDIVLPIKVSKKTAETIEKMANANGVLGLTEEDFRTALENYLRPKAEARDKGLDTPLRVKVNENGLVSGIIMKDDDFNIVGDSFKVQDEGKPANASVLDTAKDIIYGDREAAYGNPRFNLDTIAQFWSVYLQRLFHSWGIEGANLKAEDVAQMMILLKTARLIHNPTHLDSLTDQCGYAALQERIQNL